ncbi:hypothetical protein HaLaN_31736 [Haematococcus lacustris]|uniref:Uncharacterized protein n=1 Tax=Haematococcus lacustris TaxID=44745 RepID=A0A6A0AKF6_HAELA|nr:hypothetical protein HaLaN_31736 [Haematococcus lacustris]
MLYGRPLGANMTALLVALQSPMSEIHGRMRAAQQPAGASPTPWAEQQVVEEEEWSQGEAGSATTSVVRVKGMLMSPKLAPPYPLGGLLKGQVISQIQDMLKGLMAAAQHAATEDASARSTAAKPVTSSNGPARKSLGVQGLRTARL